MRARCVVNMYREFVMLCWGFGERVRERVRAWGTRQGTCQVCTVAVPPPLNCHLSSNDSKSSRLNAWVTEL